MNRIYNNIGKTGFQQQAKEIAAYQAKTGSLENSVNSMNEYFAREKLEAAEQQQDEKLEKAIEKYRSQYKMKKNEEYPEKRKFFAVKTEMEKDRLFHLFKKMPKGGLLHVHSAAGLSFEGLLLLCKGWNDAMSHYKENAPLMVKVNLRESTSRMAQYTLMFQYQEDNLIEEDICPSTQELRKFLQIEGNLEKLKNALCITSSVENDRVWKEFNIKYSRFIMLFSCKEFFREYYKAFFRECRQDNITYVELRCGFERFDRFEFDLGKAEFGEHILRSHNEFDIGDYLYYKDYALEISDSGNIKEEEVEFLKVIAEAAESAKVKAKVILTANRGLNPYNESEKTKLENRVDLAIAIRKTRDKEWEEIREMVIGFDFVNQEDQGYSTSAYADIIYGNTKCQGFEDNIRIACIPFYLHDGESNWKDAPGIKWGREEKINNVIAGSICSKYRIGHAYSMRHFPELVQAILNGTGTLPPPEKTMITFPVVEVNPISNQLLNYCSDLRELHVFGLLKNGINCVICNDDPLIFDNPGLSYDFWEVVMESEICYEMLKKLIFTAFIFQFLEETKTEAEILGEASNKFLEEWNKFMKETEVSNFIEKWS